MLVLCGLLWMLPSGPLPEEALEGQGRWTSLLPPILAVVFAIAFRSVVIALSGAFCLGAVLHFGLDPFVVIPGALDEFILSNLLGQFSLYTFGFLFAIVGMIHVCHQSGGIHGLVNWFTRSAQGRVRVQLSAFFSGLVIFFDDYANTVIVGQTFRSLTDRFRIAREKLAYIVDSTTAPIAGLALISTWIAFETFLLGATCQTLGIQAGGYDVFLRMIQYRFYCFGTLIFVLINILTRRDFGPMAAAMLRGNTGEVSAKSARLLMRGGELDQNLAVSRGCARFALIPLGVVLLGVLGGILAVGRSRLIADGEVFSLLSVESWRAAFGRTVYDPDLPGGGPGVSMVLFWASVAGGMVAVVLPALANTLSLREALKAYLRSTVTLRVAVFVLLMAWSMKTICEELGTSYYLLSLLGDSLPVGLVPVSTFLLGAGMAFAMGTSWGTMGVLIPVMLPVAYSMSGGEGELTPIFLLTAAAVLDGAIFGDHCSPISDTTILSSMASGCDHMDHVRTQLPYAFITMGLCAVLGYLPVSLGWGNPLIFWGLFPAIVLLLFLRWGKPVELSAV